jgi:hypothetical protein
MLPHNTTRWILLMGLAFLMGYAGIAGYVRHERQTAFDLIAIGDSSASVETSLGTPSAVIGQGTAFARYADTPCESPCVKQLWYENRLLLDIEAWSVDIVKHGKVTSKYHWVSP